MTVKFLGNHIIMGKIELLTGMHIGGNKDKLEIGGIDTPVIRDPRTGYPYIPGSSLKGKLRMITELLKGLRAEDKNFGYVCTCGSQECAACRIFGSSADSKGGTGKGPTRLIIRDSFPDEYTKKIWTDLDSDYHYTEAKTENNINRLTSEATPRTIERVVKGSMFNFYIVLGKYSANGTEDRDDDLQILYRSMRVLEDSGLGGNISRGYGSMRFLVMDPRFVSAGDYISGEGNYRETRYESLDSVDVVKLKAMGQLLKKEPAA